MYLHSVNKKQLPKVIALMAISLVGLIVLQVFWIRYSLKIEQQQFDNRINLALDRVIDEIDQDEMFGFMRRHSDRKRHPGHLLAFIDHDSHFSSNSNQEDSLVQHNEIRFELKKLMDGRMRMRDSIHIMLAADTPIHRFEKSEKSIFRIESGTEVQETRISIEEIGDSERKDGEEVSGEFYFEDFEKEKNDSLIGAIARRSNRMKALIHKMAVEFTVSEEKRELDLNKIDSLIHNKFSELNINAQYTFLISSRHGDSLFSDSLNTFTSRAQYSCKLFPNSFIDQGAELSISLANRNELIKKGIWAILLFSLVFTSLVILTFGYTLRLIINQKKLSEIKNDFINNITHEFKTPIATTRIALDALDNKKVLDDRTRIKHFTRIIREENERMDGQVELVLRSATSEKKNLDLHPSLMDINSLIQSAIGHLSLIVESRGGSIKFIPAENLPDLNLDETHFENAVLNILDNANKYSPAAPSILVKSFMEGPNVVVEIKDKGIGMDSKTQKKIFDKFYRVPTGNLHNVKGFGLGLNYVKSVIENLGGEISVTSNLQKGSTFTLKFGT